MKRLLMITTALLLICTPVYAEIETETADVGTFKIKIPEGWERNDIDSDSIIFCIFNDPYSDEYISVLSTAESDYDFYTEPEVLLSESFTDQTTENEDGSKTEQTYKKADISYSNDVWFCHGYVYSVTTESDGSINESDSYNLMFYDPDYRYVLIMVGYDPDYIEIDELLEYAETMHQTIEFK